MKQGSFKDRSLEDERRKRVEWLIRVNPLIGLIEVSRVVELGGKEAGMRASYEVKKLRGDEEVGKMGRNGILILDCGTTEDFGGRR